MKADAKRKPMQKAALWLAGVQFLRKKTASAAVAFLWTSIAISSSGNAPNAYWNRDNRQANVDRNNPDNRNDNCGVRPAVRVYDYELTDFSHPPSILPASASFACVWNIFVSFAISSSKNNLSLRIDVSKRLDALIKYAAFKGLGAFFAIMVSCKSDKTLFSRLWPSEYLHLFSR